LKQAAGLQGISVRGGMADELLQAKPDDQLLWFAHKAALQNGFERRLSGIGWTRPNEKETTDVMWFLGRGPIAALTPAELTATANYLDGDRIWPVAPPSKKLGIWQPWTPLMRPGPTCSHRKFSEDRRCQGHVQDMRRTQQWVVLPVEPPSRTCHGRHWAGIRATPWATVPADYELAS